MKLHTLFGQILPQRIPQRGVKVGLGNIENQSLTRTQKVNVKHRGKFSRREPVGPGEETPSEHLERQMARRDGEIDIGQEGVRALVVEAVVDAGHCDRGKRCGRLGVDAHQIPESEGRAAQREDKRIPRRRRGKAAEGVAPTLPVD